MKTAADRFDFREHQGPDDARTTHRVASDLDRDSLLTVKTWQVAEEENRHDPEVVAEVSQLLPECHAASERTLKARRDCPHGAGNDDSGGRDCPPSPFRCCFDDRRFRRWCLGLRPRLAALLLACAAPGLFSKSSAHPGSAIAVDPDGRIYFATGPLIVRIDTNGTARTVVFDRKNEKFHQLHHFQRLPDGALVTASDLGNALWRFTPEGQLSSFYPPPNSMRALAVGTGGDPFAVDAQGNVLAVNSGQDRFTQILRVDRDGRIRLLAGGEWGHADGPGEAARFADLHGGSLLVAPDGTLCLTDDRRWVRRVSRDGTVSTIAGGLELAHVDGPGPVARFDGAAGLARLPNGDLLVAEQSGYLRQIGTGGEVWTVAGSGRRGGTDGPALAASLEEPSGVAVGPAGDVLVLEPSIPRVRRLRNGRLETVHQGIPPE